MGGSGILEQTQDHGKIGAISDSNLEINSAFVIRPGPVDHLAGDKTGVGNNHFGSQARANGACPHTDMRDFSTHAADFNNVPGLHRSLKEQNDSRNKIVEDVL